MTLSEIELVKKAKQGDHDALAEIVARNEKMVYNTALRLVANTEDAECVLQETFLKVFQALGDFKGRSSLSTWIYRIATNFALMHLRGKKKEFPGLENVEKKASQNAIGAFNRAIGNNPHRAIVNKELKNRMEQAISDLPPKFRSVFVLKDVEGFSLKEISEMLDMSLAAVKSNLHRARLFLRDQLAEYTDLKNR